MDFLQRNRMKDGREERRRSLNKWFGGDQRQITYADPTPRTYINNPGTSTIFFDEELEALRQLALVKQVEAQVTENV